MVGNTGGSHFFFKRMKSAGRARTGAANPFGSTTGWDTAPADEGAKTEVIPLKHAQANSLVQTLQPLFTRQLAISADAASNTLIVKGQAEVVGEVKKLAEKLDALADAATTSPSQGKRP
jgi:type II secretory pathway component GspD/PulD (secretin)